MIASMILFLGLLSMVSGQVMEGLVQLDKSSIDKMLGAFEYSLLKFDVGYPTGEKHKGFGAFALNSVSLSNLLAAEVRIKDYGDKANQDVAERFGVSTEKAGLPETILFKRLEGEKVEEVARYGGDYTMASLRLFLASKAGLSITMEGCIKELDQLAQMFSQAGSKEEREKILFSAESWAKEAEDKETAKVYTKMMQSGLEEGVVAVERERARVNKIINDKASDKVKERMTKRLNVLSSFATFIKDEL